MKRADPNASCHMQNDKLYVNNKIYVFNDLQGKVKEFCLNPFLQKDITESFKILYKHCFQYYQKENTYQY